LTIKGGKNLNAFVQIPKTEISIQEADWIQPSILPFLQEKLDQAEKCRQKPFNDFSDIEMIQWYLLRREYLDTEKDRSEKTIQEYARELRQFVQQLIQYANEIDIDIEDVKEGSLFKSLDKRHIRRYQEWLAKRSPYEMLFLLVEVGSIRFLFLIPKSGHTNC